MSAVGDVIQPGQPIPDDVTGFTSHDGDRATRTEGLEYGAWSAAVCGPQCVGHDDREFQPPLTVTAVREQPAEPGSCDCESDDCKGECCGVGNCTCTPEVEALLTAAMAEPVAEVAHCGNDAYVHEPHEWLGMDAAGDKAVKRRCEGTGPGRKLIGPPHAHLDAPCTDACYAPAEPEPQQADASPLLDLVEQYGDKRASVVEAGECAWPNKVAEHEQAAAVLLEHIEVEVQQLRGGLHGYGRTLDEIAAVLGHDGPMVPDLVAEVRDLLDRRDEARADAADYAARLKATDASWAKVAAERDRATEERDSVLNNARDLRRMLDAAGEHDARRSLLKVVAERDLARAELKHHLDSVDRLAEERNEAVAERDSIKAEFDELASFVTVSVVDPLVLRLPEVPEGTVALVGDMTKEYYRPQGGRWWTSNGVGWTFSELLGHEGTLRFELGPPHTTLDDVYDLRAELARLHPDGRSGPAEKAMALVDELEHALLRDGTGGAR